MTWRPRPNRPFEKDDELQRYDGASAEQIETWKREDPLRFTADHVPGHDRRNGSVVVLMTDRECDFGVLNVVDRAPRNPGPDECHQIVSVFAEAAELNGLQVGLILHRHGPAMQTDVDERWHAALLATAAARDVPVLGTVVRTASGDLVRVTRRSTSVA